MALMITGASGFLGSNLSLQAADSGLNVLACSRRTILRGPRIHPVLCDPFRMDELDAIIQRYRPTYILHCAALTDVDYCERHPEMAFRTNVELTGDLAQLARKYEIPLVYVSTDSVFDGAKGSYSESDQPNPVNQYARTKWLGEIAVQECWEQHLIVRTNFYGWDSKGRNLASFFFDRLCQKAPTPGFQDVIFAPVHSNQLAAHLFQMLEKEARGIVHLCGSESVSKFEFGRRLAKSFGFREDLILPARLSQAHFCAKRPLNTALISERLTKEFDILPPSLDEGIQLLVSQLRSGFRQYLKRALGATGIPAMNEKRWSVGAVQKKEAPLQASLQFAVN